MEDEKGLGAARSYLHLGLQLGTTIVLFTLLGYWLDGKYDTLPWWTVGGAAFGMTAGLYNFIRATIRQEQSGHDDGEHDAG